MNYFCEYFDFFDEKHKKMHNSQFLTKFNGFVLCDIILKKHTNY